METRELLRIFLLTALLTTLIACGGGDGEGKGPGGKNPAPDLEPDPVMLTDIVALPGFPVMATPFAVSGIDEAVTISVTGEGVTVVWSSDGGETFSTESGKVNEGEEVLLKVEAESGFEGARMATVRLGEYETSFGVHLPAPLEVVSDHKKLSFEWGAAEGEIAHYVLSANRGGIEGFDEVLAASIPPDQTSIDIEIVTWEVAVPGTRYLLEACNAAGGCVSWPNESVLTRDQSLATISYLKAPTPVAGENFGSPSIIQGNNISFTTGGRELLVGVPNAMDGRGVVQRFKRSEHGDWEFAGAILPPAELNGGFGEALAVSKDDSWLLIGEPSAFESKGQVHIYQRNDDAWKFHEALSFDRSASSFGKVLAVSADGSVIAIGAPNDNAWLPSAGSVTVYRRDENKRYIEDAYIWLADSPGQNDYFGSAVALSDDGSLLAVGVPYHDSADDSTTDNSLRDAGSVMIYRHSLDSWSLERVVKSSKAEENGKFGSALTISPDGTELFAGSSRMGAEIFDGTAGWASSQIMHPIDEDDAIWFGSSIRVSGDGQVLLVANPAARSGGPGMEPADSSAKPESGAIHLFRRSDAGWVMRAYLKATVPDTSDLFGASFAISADGRTIAVGAPREDGDGVNGPENNDIQDSGAIYIY